MIRFFAILLTLCCGLAAAPLSLAADSPDAQRLQAARQFVTKLGMAELFVGGAKMGFANSVKQDPSRTKELAWVLEQITVAEAIDRLTPIYAEFLTASQAKELQTFFTTNPGDKFWRAVSATALAGKPFTMPPLSAQENRQIEAFANSSAALRTFSQSQPTIQTKMKAATNQWMRELAQRFFSEFSHQIADAVDPNKVQASAQDGANAPGGPMSEVVALVRDYNARNQKGIAEYLARVNEIDLSTTLKPANLTAREGIAEGRNKVDRFEAEFNRRWREYNAATDELVKTLKGISNPSKMLRDFMVGAEKGLSTSYERALRLEENQRTLIILFRQVLTLADERFGKIRSENNRLIFENTDDLNTYRSLQQRLDKEADIEAKLAEEEQQAREASLRKLRGEPTTQSGSPQEKPATDSALNGG